MPLARRFGAHGSILRKIPIQELAAQCRGPTWAPVVTLTRLSSRNTETLLPELQKNFSGSKKLFESSRHRYLAHKTHTLDGCRHRFEPARKSAHPQIHTQVGPINVVM